MALSSNVQSSILGSSPPLFSLFPIPGSSVVNVFAQSPLHQRELFANHYAFPPNILIPDLLSFLSSQAISCTLVVPDVYPFKFWWPLYVNKIPLSWKLEVLRAFCYLPLLPVHLAFAMGLVGIQVHPCLVKQAWGRHVHSC
mgnify:CR=1 FL=1